MYTYAKKKGAPESAKPSEQSLPESVKSGFNAINNVDVHSGTRVNLEGELKSRIEQSLGFNLDNVEMRESHDAADMDAKAFAKGNVVHFAPGQFRPDTEEGRHLITHELTHVAQQARGNVQADVAGLNVNASESLENQADNMQLGGSPAMSALPSLPSMNAEAAPIQGAFGKIKKFFSNLGKSFKAGRELKKKDDVVKSITDEYNAETSDMMQAMKSSGFSEDEIQAQLLFQRLNRHRDREIKFTETQAEVTDNLFNLDLDNMRQGANMVSNLGRGRLTSASRQEATDAEHNFIDNILTGDEDIAAADQQAAALSKKYGAKNALDSLDDDIKQKNAVYNRAIARYNQNNNTNYGLASGGGTHENRFLSRHMNGLSDEQQDSMMADIFSGDKARMAPHLQKEVRRYLDNASEDAVSDGQSDEDLVNNFADQAILNSDNHSVSDLIKEHNFNADELGLSQQDFDEYFRKKTSHSTKAALAQRRVRHMAGITNNWGL